MSMGQPYGIGSTSQKHQWAYPELSASASEKHHWDNPTGVGSTPQK
jgi:hypothetical protein